ncbi:MAG: hypothetical protein LBK42_05985 [Propionibacteriaceae bacterium]|jgi:predicted transcriptional regulator|nr:hypothetical protein [Propionibacteriaceae bacterium]
MRTTLLLADDVYKRAKHLAVDQGRTLTSVFEEALRDYLYKRASSQSFSIREVAAGDGGMLVEADQVKRVLADEDVERDLGGAP